MNQIVTISRGQTLTRSRLSNILNSAKSTYDYARFNLHNGIYVTISFFKDNTIEIMTNSRDIIMWQQIKTLRSTYTMSLLLDFLVRWINKINII